MERDPALDLILRYRRFLGEDRSSRVAVHYAVASKVGGVAYARGMLPQIIDRRYAVRLARRFADEMRVLARALRILCGGVAPYTWRRLSKPVYSDCVELKKEYDRVRLLLAALVPHLTPDDGDVYVLALNQAIAFAWVLDLDDDIVADMLEGGNPIRVNSILARVERMRRAWHRRRPW